MKAFSWNWLKYGWLKKETEGLLTAAQDQLFTTRNYKVAMMREQGSKKCGMCNARDKTSMHVLSEFEKVAEGEYKKKHNLLALIISIVVV